MMGRQAVTPSSANPFANLACSMCSAEPEALSQKPNDRLVSPHNKNDKSWLPWRRPCGTQSERLLLDYPKAKLPSATKLTKPARWSQIFALRREQLYRRSSKIQIALSRSGRRLAYPTSLCRLKLRKLPTSPRPGFVRNVGAGFVGRGRRTRSSEKSACRRMSIVVRISGGACCPARFHGSVTR
jgi:hypothetical protein